ncbi:MAG: 4-cresol dehydrogenase (hydroxylating) flavoprotein subunit [Solirubrobacteraceae bacterium]|nr:4-cresol dehydrogenase (hydroxylating) flavoprotein subunit [Solirubrobacteraceae bacterium]
MSDVGTRPVPPGLTERDVERAIERLEAALGSDKVLTDPRELHEFRDPFQVQTSDDFLASAVVMPTTVEEIQAVVAIANETKVPLWTHAQGRNNGYGGPAPRVSGSIIVSLRNMNKVLEINEKLGYAVVEPGVRWFDLYEAVQAGGHKLMVSIADLGWGSVVGNSLDNGATYMPYGVDQASWCGMEVVLANGDVMRTGMGAMPGNKSWHLYKRSLGPSADLMFTQSNYGIVTKMGYWLMPEPETYMPLWLRLPKDDDLATATEVMRKLMLDDTLRMNPQIMSGTLLAAVMSDRKSHWDDPNTPIPEDVLDKMAEELQTGRWIMRFALYGDEAVVDHRYAKVKDAFESAIPGAAVWGQKYPADKLDTIQDPSEQVQAGIPSLDLNAMTGWYGGEQGGHIGFSPVVPMTGEDAIRIRDIMRREMEAIGLDYMAALIPINARSMIHVTMVIFDTASVEQSEKAYAACRRAVTAAAKEGYGEYRAHLDFMDLATEQYSFGDHAQRRFNETIKDALDPNGILSPGKQSIWPARMRELRAATNGSGA